MVLFFLKKVSTAIDYMVFNCFIEYNTLVVQKIFVQLNQILMKEPANFKTAHPGLYFFSLFNYTEDGDYDNRFYFVYNFALHINMVKYITFVRL